MTRSTLVLVGSLLLAGVSIALFALIESDQPALLAKLPPAQPIQPVSPAHISWESSEGLTATPIPAPVPRIARDKSRPAAVANSQPLPKAVGRIPREVFPDNGAGDTATTATAPNELGEPETPMFALPSGLQVPAVMTSRDPALRFSPLQDRLLRETREKFLQAVQENVQTNSTGSVEEATWTAAQSTADTSFRKLFGEAAYLRQSLNSARIPLEAAP